MVFAPALALGIPSFAEAIDLKLNQVLSDEELATLAERLSAVSPRGLVFTKAERLFPGDLPISTRVVGARYAVSVAHAAAGGEAAESWAAAHVERLWAAASAVVRREAGGLAKNVDVRAFLDSLRMANEEERATLARTGFGPAAIVVADIRVTPNGSARPLELRDVLFPDLEGEEHVRYARLQLLLSDPSAPQAAIEVPEARPEPSSTLQAIQA
jgi:hypothetical protein